MSERLKRLRENVNFAREICNIIRDAQRTRFMSSKLHVSDIISCHAKLYLDRAYDPAQICSQLVKMHMGFLFEENIVSAFKEMGFLHEPVYAGRVTNQPVVLEVVNGIENNIPLPEFLVQATPDFVFQADPLTPPVEIVEVKTTVWNRDAAHRTATRQSEFMNDVAGVAGTQYAIPAPLNNLFLNFLLQVAAYDNAVVPVSTTPPIPEVDKKNRIVVIYQDVQEEFDLPRPTLSPYYSMFLQRVPAASYALYKAVNTQTFQRDVFIDIFVRELSDWGMLLASIQCPTCPYRTTGICPTVPPMREPREVKGDFERIRQFAEDTPGVGDGRRLNPLFASATGSSGKRKIPRDRYIEFLRGALSGACANLRAIQKTSRIVWEGLFQASGRNPFP